MAIKKDQGFTLRTFDFRETSKIAHVFTANSGKIHVLLKGFRSGKKEFATTLNTFSLNDLVFYESRADLWLVSQAELVRDFGYLARNMEKNLVANFIVELVDKITPLHHPQKDIFSLIAQTFGHLEKEFKKKILYIFQIKILELAGFRPHLTACVKCSQEIKKEAFFSVKLGGLLCPECRLEDGFARDLSAELILGLKYMQNNDFDVSLRLTLAPETEREILEILEDFLSFHLDARIKSLSSAKSLES